MRKILMYILVLVCICFLIPIIFTKVFLKEENNSVAENEIATIRDYDYSKYTTIKLFHSKTEKIEEVNLDEYLCNVVSAEMPANYEAEALKAQAIVARTYTIYKVVNNDNKHGDADICDSSTCCQAWISKEDRLTKWSEDEKEANWNKIVSAVDATIGKIITYEGEPINAFFHSSSGGTTEVPINVWGGSAYPYLQSVETAGEEEYGQYASKVTFTKDELVKKIKSSYSDFKIDFSEEKCIEITEYTTSNRVKTIKFGNLNLSGVETRTLLGLRSANFSVSIDKDNITFSVKGYGHGVGMSQTGADALAKSGSTYEDIIHHYYTGVEIIDM